MIVRWPGKTPAGTVSNHISYFGDLMATAAELAGEKTPENTDSISFIPTITGHTKAQKKHDYLYWEFYEGPGKQAVRAGKWKAIRIPMFRGKMQLYDLNQDLAEAHDVAAEHPEVVAKMAKVMAEAHVPNPNWKPR